MDTGMKKDEQVALARQLIAGAQKHFATASPTLWVGGAPTTVDDLTQQLQRFIDNRAAVNALRAAFAAKLQAEAREAPSQLALMQAFEAVVRGAFAEAADTLADFGLAPRKLRQAPTAEANAVAAAKRRATRAARHTMGSRQREQVKGSVTAALVVTPTVTTPVTSDG
jgi:hypothetical protein